MIFLFAISDKSWYKPNPGMLIKAIKIKYKRKKVLVGDRWKDIEAGNKVGCRSIFINRNYKEKKPSTQFATVKSLSGAFRIIKND